MPYIGKLLNLKKKRYENTAFATKSEVVRND